MQGKNEHSVATNFSYNLIYQVIAIIVPIITTPYVSRILSPESIGAFSYTQSICSYFTFFSIIGTDIYGQREIAFCRDDKEKRSSVFWEIFFIRFIGVVICTIPYLMISFIADELKRELLLIQTISVIGNIFNIVYLLQGVENFKLLLLRNIIVKLISILSIFVFVKQESDLWIYVLISVSSVVVGNITLWFNLKKYVNFIPIHKLKYFRHIKPSFALFIPTIALRLYDVFDKTMMGYILNATTENGYYEQALKIITISITVVTSLGNVMLPRVASLFAANDKDQIKNHIYKSFDVVWLLSIPIAFGIIGVADNMVPWFFGAGYKKVALLLQFFAIICIPMGLKNVIGIQYLIPTKQQRKYTASIVAGLIINIILNLFMIPLFQAIGAIIASIISECCIVLIQSDMIKNQLSFIESVKSAPNKVIAAFVMLTALLVSSNYLASSVINTIVLTIGGMIVYVSVLLFLHDKMTMNILKRFTKKFHK